MFRVASVYDYPEYYDILFGWDRDDEAGAYRDALHALNVDDDAEVLEVAAGTAQIGLRLARAGYRVTALDSSAAMLEYAAKVAAGERLALTTLVADMTAFSSDTRFAAAMNPMSSFRLLVDDDDVGRHLACMAVALVPGGLYLLDLTFGTDGTPESDLDEWVMARDDVVVTRCRMRCVLLIEPKAVSWRSIGTRLFGRIPPKSFHFSWFGTRTSKSLVATAAANPMRTELQAFARTSRLSCPVPDEPSSCCASYIERMAYDEDLAHRVRALLADELGVTEKRMFGGLAFLVDAKMAVAVSREGGLLLRVEPTQPDRLLTRAGT